ncbi:MAG: hypothetical protein EOO61_10410 [Hymenobacter sp.]|nr:MAG: hypothetical protein EOO61_10410 [Hymenobacter sp.]
MSLRTCVRFAPLVPFLPYNSNIMIKSSVCDPVIIPVSEYPYIAKFGSIVILVTGVGKTRDELAGMVIASNSDFYKLGNFDDRWSGEFERWDGTVTLSNL